MSKSESRNRTGLIQFRCTPAELEAIQKKAAAAGMGVSEFVRRASLQRKIGVRTDYKAIAELLRLGGLQKHLYQQMQRDGAMSPELSQAFAQTLAEIRKGILRIDMQIEYR